MLSEEAYGGYFRKKTTQLRPHGRRYICPCACRSFWGPKQLDNLDVSFEVVPEKSVLRRRREEDSRTGNQYVHHSLGLLFPLPI